MYKVYLAGPITGLTYGECTDWREKIKELIAPSIMTLSPMRGKTRLETDDNNPIQMCYDDVPLASSKGINTRDYMDCKRADAILVNVLGAERVSIGTVMEVAWARAFDKPVILIMEPEGNPHEHSMFTFPIGFRVESLEEASLILNFVLNTDQQIDKYYQR